MKKYLDIIFRSKSEETTVLDRNVAIYGSLFLALISFMLTVANIRKEYWFMTVTTGVLVAGFLVAAVLAIKKKLTLSRLLITIMCGVNFSIYAVTGENEGFAILWILLVPLMGSYLVGLKNGFLLSAYFQAFLVILFYTPLAAYVKPYYTETFVIRFPMLYFASFGACTFMICQLHELISRTHYQSYHDGLTGLHNRAYFNEFIAEAEGFKDLTVAVLDLNRLKFVNDTMGHEAGDKMIAEAGHHIAAVFAADTCCRIGGDEFAVICDRDVPPERIDMLRALAPDLSVGIASRRDNPGKTFHELQKLADSCMYSDKARYYQRQGIDRRR